MLEVRELDLPGVYEIRPKRFRDDRGSFSETWNSSAMKAAGFDLEFVQDNHSYSASRGVFRGLHYQTPPAAQAKLVRVTRGAIFDVVVDIRCASPDYGRWIGLTVSAAEWNQILVPEGFAHGFLTLEKDCEVQYKVNRLYSPEHDRAIHHADPAIGIAWPIDPDSFQTSAKDSAAPLLADVDTGFA